MDKCKKAVRRSLVIETCLAHFNPFDLYKDAPGLPVPPTPPACPACGVLLTADFIEKEAQEMEAMS
eukprot:2766407-Pleurochrysis_carterae.AAC.1